MIIYPCGSPLELDSRYNLPVTRRIIAADTADISANITKAVRNLVYAGTTNGCRRREIAGSIQIGIGPAVEYVEEIGTNREGQPLVNLRDLTEPHLLCRISRIAEIAEPLLCSAVHTLGQIGPSSRI